MLLDSWVCLSRMQRVWSTRFVAVKESGGCHTTSTFFARNRGLPQGLSTSVALAEICVAVLLHRLHVLVNIESICYVDDINLIARSPEDLCKAIDVVLEYVHDMNLSLSNPKSSLWGTDKTGLQRIAERYDIPVKDVIDTLGMQWGTQPGSQPNYEKELARVALAEQRQKRLPHLPLSIMEKAKIAGIGCLSPLNYSPIPLQTKVEALKGPLRKSLGQCHGSSEILFAVTHNPTLDPMWSWLLASCRLVWFWVRHSEETLALVNVTRRNSRLAALVTYCKKLSWKVQVDRLIFVDGQYVRWLVRWPLFRETLQLHFRRATLSMARVRRPITYAGLEDIHVVKHMKFLADLPPHAASIIVRVWTGCAMTAKCKHMLDHAYSPMCQCEQDEQTMEHLLYHCLLVPPPTTDEREWRAKPSAFSTTLLCSYWATPADMTTWESMCRRAIRVQTQSITPERRVDWKGHCVAYDASLSYLLYTLPHVQEGQGSGFHLPWCVSFARHGHGQDQPTDGLNHALSRVSSSWTGECFSYLP